jgi:predicted nucleic acid-binding protein
VKFWDTSAVVPLLIREEHSWRVAEWLRDDDLMVVWTLTPVEVVSALRRLLRDRDLLEDAAHIAEIRLNELMQRCHVVIDIDAVKSFATRLLRLHALRAADALQLGAALHWTEGHPQGRALLTFDERLAQAAVREGFVVPSLTPR